MFLKGVADVLCDACAEMKWNEPTLIQREALPVALQGKWNYISVTVA